MVKEKIKELALRTEVQVLLVFGVIVAYGYYNYLKNKQLKKDTK